MQNPNPPVSARPRKTQPRTSSADSRPARHLHLAEVVNINSKARAHVEKELALLLLEAARGEIAGLTYAATSSRGERIVGCAGSHCGDTDKAIASLFRAAVALSTVE